MKIAFVTQDGLSTVNFARWFAGELGRRSGIEFCTVSSRDLYGAEIDAFGSRHIELTTARFIHPLRDLMYFARLYQLARRERFDVLVSFGTKPNLFAPLAARVAGVPRVVLAVRGLGRMFGETQGLRDRVLSRIVRLLYRVSCRAAHRVWFTNTRDRSQLIGDRTVDEAKTFLTTNSVNVDYFDPAAIDPAAVASLREELDVTPSDFVVTMVARLIWAKGIREFLEAAQSLQATPSIRFVLVATPEPNSPTAASDEFVEALRQQPNLSWLTFRKEIRELYAASDLMVLPSYYQEGGYPRALLEPMALGKPVIAADTADCRGPVEEGKNGFLVPPRDGRALAQRIAEMHADAALCARFGRRSSEIVRERFDDRIVGRQVLAEMGVGG